MALEVRKRYPVPHTSRDHHTLPQRTYRREQRSQSLRRMTTSISVLLIVALAAGIGYTWYMGKQKLSAVANQPAVTRHVPAVFKPTKVASDAKIGSAVQMYTTEVKAGENASMNVRTNPDADCMITVKYGTVVAKDSGLVAKQADEFGIVSWAWTVAAGTPPGKWPIEVTCKNKKYSSVVSADMAVKP